VPVRRARRFSPTPHSRSADTRAHDADRSVGGRSGDTRLIARNAPHFPRTGLGDAPQPTAFDGTLAQPAAGRFVELGGLRPPDIAATRTLRLTTQIQALETAAETLDERLHHWSSSVTPRARIVPRRGYGVLGERRVRLYEMTATTARTGNNRAYVECYERECAPIIPLRKRRIDRKTRVPRSTDQWCYLYRRRSAVEREFGRLKHEFGLAHLRVRGLARVRLHADLTMLAAPLAA
jgi:hypothetical protein